MYIKKVHSIVIFFFAIGLMMAGCKNANVNIKQMAGTMEEPVPSEMMPDISVHDEAAFVCQLTTELQPLVPDTKVVVVVDHNYAE